MKAKIVYILSFGMFGAIQDEETVSVCKGLFVKHRDRCDAVGVVALDNGRPILDPQQVHGALPLKGAVDGAARLDAVAAGAVVTGAPAAPAGDQRGIGIYVVMHGPEALAEPAAAVAKAIDETLPTEAKAKVHYVVMLVCGLATDDPGIVDLDRQDASYMTVLMKELRGRGMQPIVAGWDEFVSAAPHKPDGRNVYEGASAIDDLQTIAGRKIVRPGNKRYRTVTNEYRKLHKHVYRIRDDGRLEVALGRWSDLV